MAEERIAVGTAVTHLSSLVIFDSDSRCTKLILTSYGSVKVLPPLESRRTFARIMHEAHARCVVTPGISAGEYAARRANLAAALPPRGIAVLVSAPIQYRTYSVFHEFHQEPNFMYLTGTITDLFTAYIMSLD